MLFVTRKPQLALASLLLAAVGCGSAITSEENIKQSQDSVGLVEETSDFMMALDAAAVGNADVIAVKLEGKQVLEKEFGAKENIKFEKLAVGAYTVTVTFKQNGAAIKFGSAKVAIEKGKRAEANIELSPVDSGATGSLIITIKNPVAKPPEPPKPPVKLQPVLNASTQLVKLSETNGSIDPTLCGGHFYSYNRAAATLEVLDCDAINSIQLDKDQKAKVEAIFAKLVFEPVPEVLPALACMPPAPGTPTYSVTAKDLKAERAFGVGSGPCAWGKDGAVALENFMQVRKELANFAAPKPNVPEDKCNIMRPMITCNSFGQWKCSGAAEKSGKKYEMQGTCDIDIKYDLQYRACKDGESLLIEKIKCEQMIAVKK